MVDNINYKLDFKEDEIDGEKHSTITLIHENMGRVKKIRMLSDATIKDVENVLRNIRLGIV